MVTPATAFGWRGEATVRTWLERQGWTFVAQNYRTRYGEIDLIMRDGKTLVFVEVKSRRNRRFGAPEESVSNSKLNKLSSAAQQYLQTHPDRIGSVRFDLVTLEFSKGRRQLRHIPNIGS